MDNRIEKRIELKAPISRVWRALTDYREFGQWFGKTREPFHPRPGLPRQHHLSRLRTRHLGGAHRKDGVRTTLFLLLAPLRLRTESTDYSRSSPTLVEFRLEPIPGGTLLLLTESGFDKIPADWRPEAFRRNDGGWTEQMKNIESHVTQNP